MPSHPFDYHGIRVWHVPHDTAGGWSELQKRAAREGAPIDALFLDAREQWVTARDFAPDHPIHAALALDRERRRRGFGEPRGPEKDA
jgi:HD superfamily phosphodiesterase